MPEKEFTAYKEHIQTITALIGVITVVLYVFGYVAERVHWNMLGIIQVPANHIEFLYRGGNVVISSLASVLLYPLLSLVELNGRTVLLFVLILLMLAVSFGRQGKQASSLERLWHYVPSAILILLLALSILEFRQWPESRKDLLFLPSTADASANDVAARFFASYVGLIALWLAFYFLCRRLERVKNSSNEEILRKSENTSDASTSFMFFNAAAWFVTMAVASEGDKSHAGDSTSVNPARPWIVNTWIRLAALIIVLILMISLPLVYGSFRFPHEYPIVHVLIAPTAPPELKTSLQVGDLKEPMALLYETTGEYVLYRKPSQPAVLRLKKTDVGGFVVYQSKDVTKPTLDAEAMKSQPEP